MGVFFIKWHLEFKSQTKYLISSTKSNCPTNSDMLSTKEVLTTPLLKLPPQLLLKKLDDFCAELPDNECRYGIFDLEYSKDADGVRQKIIFVVWAPDTAKIKDKMLTASSKDALKKQLIGISTEIQATDRSEIAYDYILDRVQSISR